MSGIINDSNRRLKRMDYVWMAFLLCITPLCGVVYLNVPLGPYLEFPPTTRYVLHAPFNRPVFLLLALVVAIACFPFVYRFITTRANPGPAVKRKYPFPWWGRMGIVLVAVFWVLAWNRFPFFHPLQRYTFFPLWMGYILLINGLSCRRKGTCLLRSRPRFYLTLFPVSTMFWWYLEYLNRFVQNWYYLIGENISTTEYVIHASICFSTVLPAVLATTEFLETFPRLTGAFIGWSALTLSGKKMIGWLLIAGAFFSLILLAVFPNYLFPLIWISPLLMIVGIQLMRGWPTILSGVKQGDWRSIVLPALAALMCGFFWEMWNWKSLAHWQYSIPFVHRFQIFAMPLLGYAGYLPFGLECVVVASLLNPATCRIDGSREDY